MKEDIFTPEGVIMLTIAGLLDLIGIICAILVVLFGLGAIFGQVVNVLGYTILGVWLSLRAGFAGEEKAQAETSQKKERGIAFKVAKSVIKRFLKKQWKKLIAETIPLIGDVYPGFTLMVYSELKS